ncbi:hypothetical protein QC385_36605 [Streptomyces sp. DH10]|nr:hypothetical protein [Streptomyces sp. DH10]MDG9713607.1 hypothetical protein [Streptomyces sp. DH10]
MLDRLLGDVGRDGVGAAEGDQGGAGEEQALGGEDTSGTCEDRHCGERRAPQQQAEPEDAQRPMTAGAFGVQRVVGDQWWWAVGGVRGGRAQGLRGEAGQQPADERGHRNHQREGDDEQGERGEGCDCERDEGGVGQGPSAHPPHHLGDDDDHGRG